ncbi:uncharacterized protein Bfra_010952 [Botrytis fragariae]|uniref:Uncharacterized protein n=1 Tax=Botrytis fragariae TaxID=1964551 RepID=A0A8H6ALD3_9HELO|nr:uncharacterized protein Bfra_010952 [Botrytis fragariae]KAF5869752.1 hypothetical protein Bfra_010952 [Botrytis fragariae]
MDRKMLRTVPCYVINQSCARVKIAVFFSVAAIRAGFFGMLLESLVLWCGRKYAVSGVEHLPGFEKIPPRYLHHDDRGRAKTEPGSIKETTLRGDMNMVRFAVYSLARSISIDLDFCGQPYGHVLRRSDTGADLSISLYFETWETF